MKKSRDILGEIVKGIVAFGIIGSIVLAISGFAGGYVVNGFISLGAFIVCLFIYWLVSAISKISVNINDIKQNSDIIRAYCEQRIGSQNTTVPTPTNSENNA